MKIKNPNADAYEYAGEWHHTEHFGNLQWDTAGHDPVTGLMPQAFTDRKDVLMALLHAAPKSV